MLRSVLYFGFYSLEQVRYDSILMKFTILQFSIKLLLHNPQINPKREGTVVYSNVN